MTTPLPSPIVGLVGPQTTRKDANESVAQLHAPSADVLPQVLLARTTMEKEREVITEFIELFRDLPCLWDLTCKEYRDSTQKKNAWDILATQLKKIDPAANVMSAKKKVDNLKFSYLRESKKVKESKNRAGSDASEIHKPSLWYYKLMTFLEKIHDKRLGVDSLMSKDEEVPQLGEKKRKKKITSERSLDLKKERFMDAAYNLLRTDTELNPFGLYVGKKMEEILPGPQRDIAEKLISDVLFLAKSSRLTFDTKIDIPLSQNSPYNQYFAPSPQQCSTSSDSSNRFHFQSLNRSSSHTEVKPQISHPVTSPPSHSPVFIQSVPPSSQQIPIATNRTPLHSPMQSKDEVLTENNSSHSSQITHTTFTASQHSIITANEVYTEGPTDILKQMLLETRPTSPVPTKLEIIKLEI